MSNKGSRNNIPTYGWKNEAARQRWELFHRAIAHAKASNLDALQDAEPSSRDRQRIRAALTIAK